jgi:hypothetical protein
LRISTSSVPSKRSLFSLAITDALTFYVLDPDVSDVKVL